MKYGYGCVDLGITEKDRASVALAVRTVPDRYCVTSHAAALKEMISDYAILPRLTGAHFRARHHILTATHPVCVGVMIPRRRTGRPWNLVLIPGRGAELFWDPAIVSAYRGLLP